MLDRAVIDSLFAADLAEVEQLEQRYPQRDLPDGALVTRIGPSPTGFIHIGTIYVAMINKDLANRSGGSYVVRIEDTDQTRFIEDAAAQFDQAFSYFGLQPDESDALNSAWGPYAQSAREQIYHSFARELLRQGKAYLCFATSEELDAMRKTQQATKLPTGYYGSWATWRDAPAAEVMKRLETGDPFVVRFRSPGQLGTKVRYTDRIRGVLEPEDNYVDHVILKSSDQRPWLPTYHFAHAVDDHLMRVNLVVRGEEWLSSVPIHLQLFQALGFDQVEYAHFASLMKQDGKSRRKFSKRKDPEASVTFYIEAGYPTPAILHYLRGLANGRLAEMPLEQALREPIHLEEFNLAGPLVDMPKLTHISANYIASLSGEQVLAEVKVWASQYDQELLEIIEQHPDLALSAVNVERYEANPRKDLTRWSDFRTVYGLFFPEIFQPVTDPADVKFVGLDPSIVQALCADFADHYFSHPDRATWFEQIRELAVRNGFTLDRKEYKKNPDAYPGALPDAANVIRVALTGSRNSPDLHQIAETLGAAEVIRRARLLTN